MQPLVKVFTINTVVLLLMFYIVFALYSHAFASKITVNGQIYITIGLVIVTFCSNFFVYRYLIKIFVQKK